MTREEAIVYFESLLKRFEEMRETETSYWGKAHEGVGHGYHRPARPHQGDGGEDAGMLRLPAENLCIL